MTRCIKVSPSRIAGLLAGLLLLSLSPAQAQIPDAEFASRLRAIEDQGREMRIKRGIDSMVARVAPGGDDLEKKIDEWCSAGLSSVLGENPWRERELRPEWKKAQGLLEQMIQHIVQSNHLAVQFSRPVRLCLSPVDNAAVIEVPDGRKAMVVTSSFLHGIQSDSELANVLSHELAHAVLNHNRDTKMLKKEIYKISKFWGERILRMDRLAMLREQDRQMELEADRLGLVYAIRAGYDLQDYVSLMERDVSEDMKGWNEKGDQYSTHPRPDLRAQFIKQWAQNYSRTVVPLAAPVNHLAEIKKAISGVFSRAVEGEETAVQKKAVIL